MEHGDARVELHHVGAVHRPRSGGALGAGAFAVGQPGFAAPRGSDGAVLGEEVETDSL